jgi:hypothetical protein
VPEFSRPATAGYGLADDLAHVCGVVIELSVVRKSECFANDLQTRNSEVETRI